MSTQYQPPVAQGHWEGNYAPQQTPPPPPAPRSRPAKWVPQVGIRNIVTLDKLPGRLVPSTFGVSEVVFEVDGGHPWYLPQVMADTIYSLQLQPGQQIEVTVTGKKKTDLLIVPLQPRLAPAGPAAQAAPAGGGRNSGYHTPVPPMPPSPPPPPPVRPPEPPPSAPAAKEFSTVSLRFMAAYKDATDILIEEKAYAQSRGLALEIRCEDVRCLAATIMIDQQKGGR
jgi:hypothetical protein